MSDTPIVDDGSAAHPTEAEWREQMQKAHEEKARMLGRKRPPAPPPPAEKP